MERPYLNQQRSYLTLKQPFTGAPLSKWTKVIDQTCPLLKQTSEQLSAPYPRTHFSSLGGQQTASRGATTTPKKALFLFIVVSMAFHFFPTGSHSSIVFKAYRKTAQHETLCIWKFQKKFTSGGRTSLLLNPPRVSNLGFGFITKTMPCAHLAVFRSPPISEVAGSVLKWYISVLVKTPS